MKYQPEYSFLYNDTTINYRVIGEGSTDIIMLHGFGLSSYSWVFVEDYFDHSKYRLIIIDFKGAGFSDKPKDSDYSIPTQAAIVDSLKNHLKIKEFVILAHSYGGVVALYYINQYKNTGVQKVILEDTPGFTDYTPFFIKALQNPILSFLSFKLLSSRFLAKHIIKSTFYDNKESLKRLTDQYAYFYSIKDSKYAMKEMAKQIIPVGFEKIIEKYKELDIPVHIIWGENDELIPLKMGVKLNNALKTSQLYTIPKCGHVPHEECPRQYFNLIKEII